MTQRQRELTEQVCEYLRLVVVESAEGWEDVEPDDLETLRASNEPLEALMELHRKDSDVSTNTGALLSLTVPTVEKMARGHVDWREAIDLADTVLQEDYPRTTRAVGECARAVLLLAREFTDEGRRTEQPRILEEEYSRVPNSLTLWNVRIVSERSWEPGEERFWALFIAASIGADTLEEAARAWLDNESAATRAQEVTPPQPHDLEGQLACLTAVMADRERRESSSPEASELLEQLKLMRRTQLEDRTRLVRTEEKVGIVAEQVRQQGDLLLALPDHISAQLREDWKAEAEFVAACDAVLNGWHETASAERDEAPLRQARESVGDAAWDLLAQDSRDDLLASQLIKQNFDPKYAAYAAIGFFRAFERELRFAMETKSRRWAPGDWTGATLQQLVDAARTSSDSDRLRRIAVRADEMHLVRLRNQAAHPGRFTPVEMETTERVLFDDGLDGKGLLGLIATYTGPSPL